MNDFWRLDLGCSQGTGWIDEKCYPCSAGSFQNIPKYRACKPCSLNMYQPLEEKTSCIPCPGYSQCSATSFECLPGYTLDEFDICTKCPDGQYKNIPGNYSCKLCPENAISCTTTEYSCHPGYVKLEDKCQKSTSGQNYHGINWTWTLLLAAIELVFLFCGGLLGYFWKDLAGSTRVLSPMNPVHERYPTESAITLTFGSTSR